MAIQSRLTWDREDSADIQSQQARDGVSVGWSRNGLLEYWDDADPSFTGETVTAVEAAANPLLPLAGRSIYYENGFIIPFLVCTNKRARRDPANRRFWRVSANYNGRGTTGAILPPATLAEIEPVVEYIADETDQVVYDDRNDKKCLTPTGNYYDEEFRKFWGCKRVRITQHELSLSHDAMAERKRKCNEFSYRGDAAYTWQIMDIQAKDVEIQLAAGPTICVLVEYDILTTGKPGGWKEQRAIIDSHFLGTANDLSTKQPHYSEELKSYTPVMLELDGTKKSDQTTPTYDGWEIQDHINFDNFLRA